MLKETIKTVTLLQKEELKKRDKGIRRECFKDINLTLPYATVISGIRRCGKSTLLNQLIVTVKRPHYFNFEDPRAFNFDLSDFHKLEEVFKEINGEGDYYFFDEIQNVENWERYIRKLIDSGKRCVITGSNASILSRELGTKLTGRHLTFELFPFSYKEMLVLTTQKKSIESFNEYFKRGGFPNFLKFEKIEILQELFDDIIQKDIIVRHKLKESKTIKELAIFLLTNIGKEFSYNNLAKYCNIGSVNTVISYISYFEDSYLFFTVPKFDYSYKKQLVNPKKIYSIDVGLANASSASFSEDKGRILENLVFLHLRRKYKRIFYFRKKRECDFIVTVRKKPIMAIQVCYEVTEENKEREIGGLQEAMETSKTDNGVIVTYNQEDIIGNIKLIPFWKWASPKNN